MQSQRKLPGMEGWFESRRGACVVPHSGVSWHPAGRICWGRMGEGLRILHCTQVHLVMTTPRRSTFTGYCTGDFLGSRVTTLGRAMLPCSLYKVLPYYRIFPFCRQYHRAPKTPKTSKKPSWLGCLPSRLMWLIIGLSRDGT